MQETIEIAKRNLLNPSGLTEYQLERIIAQLCGRRIDYADIYFQSIYSESWLLEDGIVKEGDYNVGRGVGIRAIQGEKTGFAYSDDIILPTLEQAATAASSIAKKGTTANHVKAKISSHNRGLLYPVANPIQHFDAAAKIALLRQIDSYARSLDTRIKQVVASLSATFETILIINHEGRLVADIRPLVRLNVSVIVEQNGRREKGSSGGGGRYDYQHFIKNDLSFTYARDAVREAIVNLEAIDAPAGALPVVLGPGWPGVLLHEAVGHGLEGDFNRKGTSAFSGRIGERVAAPGCTVVDDGTLQGRRGSLNVDDEGTPSQCTMLIENGILKGYMHDSLNASLMGVASTGNGRRESYAHLPMPRMTNTYMLAGPYEPHEIIASVERGIYAVNFSGGQVDITSGKFVFAASEAYLIEKGKVTRPIKGATLIGNGPEVLTKVSMIGNDLKLDAGVGVCGKNGQSVPVGVGQPTLKIDSLTVGGTAG